VYLTRSKGGAPEASPSIPRRARPFRGTSESVKACNTFSPILLVYLPDSFRRGTPYCKYSWSKGPTRGPHSETSPPRTHGLSWDRSASWIEASVQGLKTATP